MIEKKEKILEILKDRGPSLPSNMAGEINLSLLFTSALLSEMVSDKTIVLSHLKIGGSPLYFLAGQDEQLEKFTSYLAPQEREVFSLLKEKKILDEESLTPMQRVALKNIKDFAITIKEKEKTFWRLYSIPEEEALQRIDNILERTKKKEEAIKELMEEEKDVIKKTTQSEIHKISTQKEESKEVKKEKQLHPEIKITKKRADKSKAFKDKVKEYLKGKEVDIYRDLEEGNKICIALVDSTVGLLKFLVYGINKAAINEADISLAFSEGQQEKLPVLLVTNGKTTQKAQDYIKKLGSITIYKMDKN
jgi:hypothetical protein